MFFIYAACTFLNAKHNNQPLMAAYPSLWVSCLFWVDLKGDFSMTKSKSSFGSKSKVKALRGLLQISRRSAKHGSYFGKVR